MKNYRITYETKKGIKRFYCEAYSALQAIVRFSSIIHDEPFNVISAEPLN